MGHSNVPAVAADQVQALETSLMGTAVTVDAI
jgi:hypothetical protein